MDTYVQDGKVIDVVVAATVTAGVAVIVGTMVGIPQISGVSGDTIPMMIEGVHNLPLKAAGGDPAIGDVVSFDETDGCAIGAGTTGDVNAAGKVVQAGLGTDSFVVVKLTPAAASIAA